jgi:hypothetical protein
MMGGGILCVICNKYRVFVVKRYDFGEVLKNKQMFFQMLMVSCLLQKFEFSPKCLVYFAGYRWGKPIMLT